MSIKKHKEHPHLTGEHKYGDMGQLILFFIFMGIWITDSFVFRYSNFLLEIVPNYLRLGAAGLSLFAGWFLARGGMKAVFGTQREKPEVISEGAFRMVRHPIYSGALLFYLTAIFSTMSLLSAAFWILIAGFYIFICKYEEALLTEKFGKDYLEYKEKTGMLFPKLF